MAIVAKGDCENQNVFLSKFDMVLAAHNWVTAEKLDFIASSTLCRAGIYDIKYRMGREAENEEE